MFEELGFSGPLAVKVVVLGDELHFDFAEDKREEPVLPTPFGCC